MEKLVVVIVIYNIELEDSASFQEIVKWKAGRRDIIVVDNTTVGELRERNEEAATRLGTHYLSMQENIGLSRAYNLAIDSVKKDNTSAKWVITLDQDSYLSEDYFKSVCNAVDSLDGSLIYYPKVEAGGRLLSPAPLQGCFLRRVGKCDDLENIICINSGLLINMQFFSNFRYDESLFLDMVDYDLFCTLAERGETDKITELGCTIRQDFSGAGFSGFEKDLSRFQRYAGDFRMFCRKWLVSRFTMRSVLLKRALKLSMHYKSMSFLFKALK